MAAAGNAEPQAQQHVNGAARDAEQQQQRNTDLLEQIVSSGSPVSEQRDRLLVMRAELDYKQRLATMFARSGCFSDIKGTSETEAIAKAMVKIKLGESMGFSEAESMTGIDIIQGRVAVGANLRAARMQKAGYSWPQMILTNEGCWIPLEFQGKKLLQQKVNADGTLVFDGDGNPVMVQTVVSFTKQDAVTAGLFGKDNYKKNPRNMFFARAVTNAQRWYAASCLGIDILDTYEAKDLADGEPQRASLSIDSLRPSADENRGHDATAPAADAKPAAEQPDQKPPKPPTHLEDLDDFPADQDPWCKVKGVVYHLNDGGNYTKYEPPKK